MEHLELGSEIDIAAMLSYSPSFLLYPSQSLSSRLCALATSPTGWFLVPSGTYWEEDWGVGEISQGILPPSHAPSPLRIFGSGVPPLLLLLSGGLSSWDPGLAPQASKWFCCGLLVFNPLNSILFLTRAWLVQLLPGCVTLIILSLTYLICEIKIKPVMIALSLIHYPKCWREEHFFHSDV